LCRSYRPIDQRALQKKREKKGKDMQKKKRNNKRMLSSVWKTSEYEKKQYNPKLPPAQ
jgi:hypothetical protein